MKRWIWVVLLSSAVVLLTRLPDQPGQMYSFDQINFAYAIGKFDIEQSQPQPPGYPLFVLQERLLFFLRVKRPESILLFLRIGGSIASLVACYWAGRRLFGHRAAVIGSVLFALHPAFWFAGLTSEVRIQLALVSLAVGGACALSWRGDRKWCSWSGVLLGLGAGIRPELGPLLLPLWAVGVLRSEPNWAGRARQSALLTAAVLVWLLPTAWAAGGLLRYFEINRLYLAMDPHATSAWIGASGETSFRALIWLMVWTAGGLAGLALPLAFAPRLFTRDQWLFVAVWFVPAFVFAIAVHVADAGHVLAMVPVLCLAGGRSIAHAAEKLETAVPRYLLVSGLFFLPLIWIAEHWRPEALLYSTVGATVVAGFLLRRGRREMSGWVQRWQAETVFAIPALILSIVIWFEPVWYFGSRNEAIGEKLRDHFHSALRQMSRHHVKAVTDEDDRGIAQIRALASERPGEPIVIWREGRLDWRKIEFYLPNLPLWVLERGGTAKLFRGPVLERVVRQPFALPRGVRRIWVEKAGIHAEDVPVNGSS